MINIPQQDRIFRTITGGLLAVSAVVSTPWNAYIFGLVTGLLLGTALVGFCPVYDILNGRKKKR